MAECIKCRSFNLCPWAIPPEIICSQFKPTTQTNADRIRQMTDEELANFIGYACQDAFAYGAGLRNRMLIYPFGTREETMDWLKAPVEDK